MALFEPIIPVCLQLASILLAWLLHHTKYYYLLSVRQAHTYYPYGKHILLSVRQAILLPTIRTASTTPRHFTNGFFIVG
jgi:hypothetical protein